MSVVRVREKTSCRSCLSAGRYVDRIVSIDGRLKYKQRLCIFDSALIANSIIYPI
jgi:salicylate 5-hydroxylase small subunit